MKAQSPSAAQPSAPARGSRLCPYCLRRVASFQKSVEGKNHSQTCPECLKIIPALYTHKYDDCPPVVFSLVGRPRHGKTVYLASLLYALDQLRERYPDFYYKPLDSVGMDTLRTLMHNLREGRLPESQPKMFPRPVILELGGLPRVGGCRLLLYDTGGEIFNDTPNFKEYGEYTVGSRAVVWLVSLRDLESPEDLDALLQVYTEGLLEWNVNPRQQMLLVVLTKGDVLKEWEGMPAEVKGFLEGEEEEEGFDPWQRQEALSQALESWLNPRYNFPRAARRTFAAVRYCVVSALGHDPQGQTLEVSILPRGVLMPLYWLWTFQGRPKVTVQEPEPLDERGAAREALYFSLEEAVRRAPAGATVRLERGTYRLAAPLAVARPLRLEGAGMDETQVVCGAGGHGLAYSGAGLFSATGITFRHKGPAAGHVLSVARGEVRLEACRFRDALCTLQRGGCGLKLAGDVRGTVTDCEFLNNGCYGVLVQGQARPVLERNVCRANEQAGVAYFGAAGGVARNNTCAENMHGIYLSGEAAPVLEENGCLENTGCGIFYTGTSGGRAVANRCERNREDGLHLEERSLPEVRDNSCAGNGEDGLHVGLLARPTLGENHCSGNGESDFTDERER
jgi:parallel beta-helix repeat protein